MQCFFACNGNFFNCAASQNLARSAAVQLSRAKNPQSDRKREDEETKMSKPMTKTELVSQLATEMGSDKKSAAAALDGLATIVMREVANGGAVTVPGIGKIHCRARPERQVRNPATGESLTKPADKAVKVVIAKALKDSVNS
jgi:DNA-binding protein HU-beta